MKEPFQQSYAGLQNNKLLRRTLKNLIHRLLHQFRSEIYNVNDVIKYGYSDLHAVECPTPEFKEPNRQSQLKQVEQIWGDISIFMWELACSPKTYVQMFKDEQIHAEETEAIDMHTFSNRIYKKVIGKCRKATKYTELFCGFAADQIFFFLELVSAQICMCFMAGKKIIGEQIESATELVQKSPIINFFVLYKIFSDIAHNCRESIVAILEEGIFRNIEMETVVSFANYTLEKYELLNLRMDEEFNTVPKAESHLPNKRENHPSKQRETHTIESTKQKALKRKDSLTEKIMGSNNVRWREAIRDDGQPGILVQLAGEDEESRQQNFMLMVDDDGEIQVMNCNSLHRKWKVHQRAEENYEIVNLVKNKKAFVERMRAAQVPEQVNKLTFIDNINVLGGTMGRTLAQIDEFDSVGQFIAVLSQRTLVGGSVNYMINTVPLLGYVFVTGGYSYSFYYIFSNKYANKSKKIRELMNITVGAASSVSTGILGMAVGQTLIPVPILGAFLGGFVGGFVGQLGVRIFSSSMQNHKLKKRISEMNITIQPKGYWQVTKRNLKILEIEKEKFYESIPELLQQRMNCDRMWLTLIFFTLLSFHESELRVKFMERKLKSIKKEENFEITPFLKTDTHEYQPSLNLTCVMQYLQQTQIQYLEYHDDLVKIISKMFARLK